MKTGNDDETSQAKEKTKNAKGYDLALAYAHKARNSPRVALGVEPLAEEEEDEDEDEELAVENNWS